MAYVQSTLVTASSTTNVSATLTVTAGNMLGAVCWSNLASNTITVTYTAGSGGAWTQIDFTGNDGFSEAISGGWAYSANAGGGSTTVKCTFGSSTGTVGIILFELAGRDTTAPLDAHTTNASLFAATVSAPSVTTIAANDDLISFVINVANSGTKSTSAPYTLRQSDISTALASQDAVSTGSQSGASITMQFTNGAFGFTGAFKPASGGGFTAKFRKTLSPIGTKVGSRQLHDYSH